MNSTNNDVESIDKLIALRAKAAALHRDAVERGMQKAVNDVAAKVAPGLPPPTFTLGAHATVDDKVTDTFREAMNTPCPGCGVKGKMSPGGHFASWAHRLDCGHVQAQIAAKLRAKEVEDRRAREAPLVALVAAVPKGLDSVGWRAAVLAVNEIASEQYPITDQWGDDLVAVLRDVANGAALKPVYARCAIAIAARAYARAIAPPGPRPSPERRRGGKDVRIVIDHGED